MTSGDPDAVAVVRMVPLGLSRAVENQKLVMMIIEVSVDKNGGEKQIGQAFDYASLVDDPNETVLVFTLHIDRNAQLKIIEEAFLYLHNEEESERKMEFLWREVYQKSNESTLEFLKKSCCGIGRCLKAAEYLREITSASTTISQTNPSTWDVVSDNVAIENKRNVYKIFDNRFHPTFRKPDEWLKNHPWIAELKVETHFLFEESNSLNVLGEPTRKRGRGDDSPKIVLYPKGSVLVIKYDFVNGTHFASRVSHFEAIAEWITKMHKDGIIHGDIRGFNMLHPHPKSVPGGIEESLLIDFATFAVHQTIRISSWFYETCQRQCV
eukprot:scaffold53159_cov34-Attheya_sp.AAC.1